MHLGLPVPVLEERQHSFTHTNTHTEPSQLSSVQKLGKTRVHNQYLGDALRFQTLLQTCSVEGIPAPQHHTSTTFPRSRPSTLGGSRDWWGRQSQTRRFRFEGVSGIAVILLPPKYPHTQAICTSFVNACVPLPPCVTLRTYMASFPHPQTFHSSSVPQYVMFWSHHPEVGVSLPLDSPFPVSSPHIWIMITPFPQAPLSQNPANSTSLGENLIVLKVDFQK